MLMMKSIAQEVAPYRIRVNSICPGAIRTPINMQAWETPEAYAELLEAHPVQAHRRARGHRPRRRVARVRRRGLRQRHEPLRRRRHDALSRLRDRRLRGVPLDLVPSETTMMSRHRTHWPEYLIEAWALGTFMVSAGVVTTLVEHPDFAHSGARSAREHPAHADRARDGAHGGRADLLALGQALGRSHEPGSHADLSASLGKIRGRDALVYAAAQFAGGACRRAARARGCSANASRRRR